jgi:5'-3' exonuclease
MYRSMPYLRWTTVACCRIVLIVIVQLIDGTFELFRYFLSPAAAFDRSAPEELRAVRGVVGSVLGMLEGGATHLGVATDHVVESFRNALWPGYKTGEGIEPLLHAQFRPLEEALSALGVVVWPMVEFEADDALAAAAAMAAADARVEQVVVCSPDKDLAQCVRGDRIVQLDRRTRELRDESAVRQKFGVPPASIPDWLALVGDSADGYPGLPGWGARSAATVLARYHHLEQIPELATGWDVAVRGSRRLAATLTELRDRALLFRELATLRADAPIGADVDALRWSGPRADFATWAERLGTPRLHERASIRAAASGALMPAGAPLEDPTDLPRGPLA